MKNRHVTQYNIRHCCYVLKEHGYISGCGMRAGGYNKHWKVCPYCKLPIIDLSRENKFKQYQGEE